MEKMAVLRSIYRQACSRSSRFSAGVGAASANHHPHLGSRSFFSISSPPASNLPSGGRSSSAMRLGSLRYFSDGVTRVVLVRDPKILDDLKASEAAKSGGVSHSVIQDSKKDAIHVLTIKDSQSAEELPHSGGHDASKDTAQMPVIKDPEILNVFKDLMGADWGEIPSSIVTEAKKALSKTTDDKAGQEVLKNVFRAAEAVEEFCGILISMKMELDDSIGMSGEDVKPLSEEFVNALKTVYQRYKTYLDAFGPDETYLRKKVEMELGSKMIYLKMRCSSLGSEWGKVTVLGTSGLSGSYVEQRA